jgi:hypothetical protein
VGNTERAEQQAERGLKAAHVRISTQLAVPALDFRDQ